MNHHVTAVLTLAAVLGAAPGSAQDPASTRQPGVSLAPEDPAKWDAALLTGWLGGNKSAIAPDWNDWYDAASFSASVGYHWTPHLKLELDLSTTSTGSVQVETLTILPGGPFPFYLPREHRFRATQGGGALAYQFFENRWFHPFVSAGLLVTRERERADAAVEAPYFRDPLTRVPLPPLEPIANDVTALHPSLGTGFKAYVSERAFIRSDLRVAFSAEGAQWFVWRGGMGFDF